MKKGVLVLLSLAVFTVLSFASTPIKLSLWDKFSIPQDDSLEGLELGIGSYTPNVKGVSFNLLFSKTDNAFAWQTGIVTLTNNFEGLQLGFINWNQNNVSGIQLGFFNKAISVKGLQLGFINVTENMQGVQIGLVNLIKTGKL
ncbi:MAG: hypothetical protein LBD57_06315, partial [Endomicrobium sp.]|uniref:LA_2272 family surface repeat-containing protein n=1 Tax=Candidatus Endomicrobiellum cubanum TaxID=3242325 RepID=UPI00282DB793|nr:hypothetical protein [Endomicrobium sp.]